VVLCGVGFSEASQGVQGAKKWPPAGKSHQRPDAPLAHLDLAIPRRVASPQSPTPLHQANVILGQRGLARSPKRNKRTKRVVAARLHRPFFFGRRGPRGRKASLSVPVDSASVAGRNSD
jgi:hypothetical protein